MRTQTSSGANAKEQMIVRSASCTVQRFKWIYVGYRHHSTAACSKRTSSFAFANWSPRCWICFLVQYVPVRKVCCEQCGCTQLQMWTNVLNAHRTRDTYTKLLLSLGYLRLFSTVYVHDLHVLVQKYMRHGLFCDFHCCCCETFFMRISFLCALCVCAFFNLLFWCGDVVYLVCRVVALFQFSRVWPTVALESGKKGKKLHNTLIQLFC